MIRSLIKFALLAVVAILGYNYFFGSTAEKENSRKIFGEVNVLFGSVKDLVRSEREKYDAGKYDNAVNKVDDILGKLRSEAQGNSGWLRKIDDLDKQRTELQQKINSSKKSAATTTDKTEVKKEFDQMTTQLDSLMDEMNQ